MAPILIVSVSVNVKEWSKSFVDVDSKFGKESSLREFGGTKLVMKFSKCFVLILIDLCVTYVLFIDLLKNVIFYVSLQCKIYFRFFI